MKHWNTTDVGPLAIEHGNGTHVARAAQAAMERRNGGLPPNLHLANRGALLRVIKDQQEELVRLRAQAAPTSPGPR